MEPGSSNPYGGEIFITERRWRFYVRDVTRLVARTMGKARCDANVVLTDDRTIKFFNRRDRGKNKPTNVLTYEQPPEIFLALGVVLREAHAAGKTVAAHLSHLLVHGALHLAGHDHIQPGDARRMERAETFALARLGIKNPWRTL